MKICGSCGAGNADGNKFCAECGAAFDAGQSGAGTQKLYYDGNAQGAGSRNYGGAGNGYRSGGNVEPEIIYTTVQPRSIPVAIILSIVTCGIYALYWMYSINNEINDLAQDPMAAGGGVVLLLTLVTCGVYGWYWNYKMGEKCDFITQKNSSSGVIFLILSIFGLGLVSLCLMQDTVNRVLQ